MWRWSARTGIPARRVSSAVVLVVWVVVTWVGIVWVALGSILSVGVVLRSTLTVGDYVVLVSIVPLKGKEIYLF